MMIPHIPAKATETFSLCIQCMQHVQLHPGQLPGLHTLRYHCSKCCTLKPILETVDSMNVTDLGQREG